MRFGWISFDFYAGSEQISYSCCTYVAYNQENCTQQINIQEPTKKSYSNKAKMLNIEHCIDK